MKDFCVIPASGETCKVTLEAEFRDSGFKGDSLGGLAQGLGGILGGGVGSVTEFGPGSECLPRTCCLFSQRGSGMVEG